MEPTTSTSNHMDLRLNFSLMSIVFGIGHGVLTAATAFASSQMDARVSYVGNALLYGLTVPSCFLLSVPVTLCMGLKYTLVIGMFCYALYVVGFAGAAMSESASTAQWMFFCIGSAFGGIAAGVLWTAQGGYMGHSATAISKEEGRSRESVVGELATHFASFYLFFEMVMKILFSVGLSIGFSAGAISFAFAFVCVGSSAALLFVLDLKPEIDESKAMLAKTLDAPRLWCNVRTWLLSPTNLTFGMSAAFINGYFNANYGAIEMGSSSIGYASAFVVLVACILSRLYGALHNYFGPGLPIILGAVSFALIPILIISTGCLRWGVWLLIIYALQGSGRASYENPNKALFADTFPGADTEPAFANCILQMSVASTVQFFLSAVLTGFVLEVVVLVCAVLIPLAYLANKTLDMLCDPEKQPLIGGVSDRMP